MLIPIGGEQTTVRRLPWVSFVIMGLCILVGITTTLGDSDAEKEEAQRCIDEALEFYFEHPYLELDDRLKDFDYFSYLQIDREPPDPPEEAILQAEQAQLDDLEEKVFEAMGEIPVLKWGLIPADIQLHAVVTYMFMHGGIMHLLGNLFIFYLLGPFLEDVWGRPLFAGFYLLAGMVSGLLFALKYASHEGPLIGASGAIAGVMGAFLVRHWNTKLTFLYVFFFRFRIFSGTFQAPAWLMLGLWCARELLYAYGGNIFMVYGHDNTAYWGHVYGFAFGVAAAFVVKYLRIEERFVDQAIEEKITVFDNTAVEQAVEAGRQGRPEEALGQLREELSRNPKNLDAAAALWNLALAAGLAADAVPDMLPVLRNAARQGDTLLVQTYWSQMRKAAPDLRVDLATAVRIAEMLKDCDPTEAVATASWAAQSVTPDAPIGPLVRLARLAHSLGLAQGPGLLEMAKRHPDLSPAAAAELAQLPAAEVLAGQLRVAEAQPLALASDSLEFLVAGKRHRLALEQIKGIAAAGITSQPPVLVVDLLLDLRDGPGGLRIVRIQSTSFDPRSIVGGDNPTEALRGMIEKLLEFSQAQPLPDRRSVFGRPFLRFGSLEEYEQEVLQSQA